ncbi:methyltransferase [Streptomyces sp. DT190]|uniref:methyltransferase n=1 Tax=Streptomyces sp. DT190 TaxID=3416527 RepID=UPI003CE6E4C2
MRGIVYDAPRGLAQAAGTMERAGVSDRFSAVTGDFFASVPEGGDLYLLKSVIHDWNDDQGAVILGGCREDLPGERSGADARTRAAVKGGGGIGGGWYLSDLNVLVKLGGRERTREDFTALCERAGFMEPSITPLSALNRFSLVEATPRRSSADR